MTVATTTTRVLYDSLRSSNATGVRAGLATGRTLVFWGMELTVDVVIHTTESEWGYVYGQVIRHADGSAVNDVEVSLDGGEPVRTDECGQFAIATRDPRLAKELRVHMPVDAVTFTIPPWDRRELR